MNKLRFRYYWQDGGTLGGSVEANTAGEARAQIKKKLNVPKKKRLPIEIKLVRREPLNKKEAA